MELADMIRQAETDLRTANANVSVTQADVARAQAAYAAAKQLQADMEATLGWLRRQADLARIPEPVVDAEPDFADEQRFGRPVSEVSQADLCLMALEKLGRPSTTTEIREYLAQEGHVYHQAQVRSALKYLARKRSAPVESPRTGTWQLTHPSQPQPAPALNGAGP